MRNLFLIIGLAALVGCDSNAERIPDRTGEVVNFMMTADLADYGEAEQKSIAALMAHHIDSSQIDFIAVAGDPIHWNGVMSVHDKMWILAFESVYTAKSLQKIPFYVVSGNHEYKGSVQAILDYSLHSERWNAPARYFSFERSIQNDQQKALWVFIDTTPLIDIYRTETYSDAAQQSIEKQLNWLDSTLITSTAYWKFVIGHHPIYADSRFPKSEQADMQERVGRILEKHQVDFYIAGHLHNFQHLKPEGKSVDYIVNSAASSGNTVNPLKETVFCSPDPGYSVFSVSADNVTFSFVNHKGQVIYRKIVEKR